MTIKGPKDTSPVNVALVSGGQTRSPISTQSISSYENQQYYIDNAYNSTLAPVNSKYNTEMEGFTTLLTTQLYPVTAGQTYHIKLAIADGDENIHDSMIW